MAASLATKSDREELVSINPADGSVVAAVRTTQAREIDAVVERARAAHHRSGWAQVRPDRKAVVMHEVARRLIAEKERLAILQMRDNGKPLAECRGMVDAAAGAFRYYAGVIETHETEVTPPRGDYVSLTVLEPFGVVAAITPWNSPIMNEAQKVAPALAAGNAVILKPSEETPLLAPELARICLEAGLPEDQLQIVQGTGEEIGATLVTHPGVRMISFTGGTDTGRAIARAAGERLIPTALELGGKSPHVVFADADLEQAIAAVASGIFGSSGQSCVAGSRLFVQESVYRQVVEGVAERAQKARVAAPDDPAVEVGPLASFRHRDKVVRHVREGLRQGGNVLAGGAAPDGDIYAHGAYYQPTVIEGLGHDARLCREEIFGPVLVALPFRDEADLIAQANGTSYGLACGIWTESFKRAWRVGRALEAGSVWINTYKQSSISSPFGGFKDSGIGREKGVDGLRLYAQVKSMYFGLHTQPFSIAK
jgi:acyl-CoA reductase-like NAD-dependent aldehyde dehydrogenase